MFDDDDNDKNGSGTPGGSDKGKWTLEKDAQFMEQKTELRRKLHEGEIATEEEYNRQLLALEIEALERRIQANQDSAEDLQKLQSDLADKRYQQQKKAREQEQKLIEASLEGSGKKDWEAQIRAEQLAYEKRLRELGLFGRDRFELTDKELAALENLERNHERKIRSIQMNAKADEFDQHQAELDRKLTALKLSQNQEMLSLDTFAAKKEFLGDKLSRQELDRIRTDRQADKAIKEHFQSQEEQAAREHLQEMIDLYISYMADLRELQQDGAYFNEEELERLQQTIDKLQEKYASLQETVTTGGEQEFAGVDILGFTDEQWAKFFDRMEKGELKISDWQMAMQAVGNAFGEISALMSAAEQRELKNFERSQDQKKKALEQQLKAGRISQERYSEAIRQLDEETDTKRDEMEKRQAKRQKAMAMFQALTNTAVAITAALPNVPLSITVGALGAVQIATILATPLPGYEEGGMLVEREQDGQLFQASIEPHRRGLVTRPTVIVGENGKEYVVPAEGYENPTLRPVLDIVEQARLSGTLRHIDVPAALAANGITAPGRAGGGHLSPTVPEPDTTAILQSEDLTLLVEVLKQNKEATDKLFQKLDAPIPAFVTLYGPTGLQTLMKKYEQQRQRASIGGK